MYTSWNLEVKVIFDLPRETYRYLIEPISENMHLKSTLCSRYVSFYSSLQKSKKLYVYMANLGVNKLQTVLHAILVCLRRVNLEEHSAKVDTVR